jgi:hypothetical protein
MRRTLWTSFCLRGRPTKVKQRRLCFADGRPSVGLGAGPTMGLPSGRSSLRWAWKPSFPRIPAGSTRQPATPSYTRPGIPMKTVLLGSSSSVAWRPVRTKLPETTRRRWPLPASWSGSGCDRKVQFSPSPRRHPINRCRDAEGLCLPNAYLMDLVVEDKVLVEAKTVERLVDVHFAQVNSYLRCSGLELGLLLNFRTWPLKDGGIKRMIKSYTRDPQHPQSRRRASRQRLIGSPGHAARRENARCLINTFRTQHRAIPSVQRF